MQILKKGTYNKEKSRKEKKYIGKCKNCGCKFIYQNKDYLTRYYINSDPRDVIRCPECNYENDYWFKRKYKGE